MALQPEFLFMVMDVEIGGIHYSRMVGLGNFSRMDGVLLLKTFGGEVLAEFGEELIAAFEQGAGENMNYEWAGISAF